MFTNLFSPINIRGLELKNRIMLPAMGTKFANKDRTVSKQLVDYHVARVRGGCGLNMVEVASVHSLSAPRKFLSISDDKYIQGLKELTDAIHNEGGKAGIQLWQGSLAVGMDKAAMILVASDMPVSEELTLPAITPEQIGEIVTCFGLAAERAVRAGFDCVEIHAAHNYLIHSFLSGGLNHRTDEYGGSFENRVKFPLAVIREVRKNVPDSMPVFMRIGAHDDYLENGLTIEEVIEFCKLAKEAGVDVLDVSRGNIITSGLKYEVPSIDLERGFNIENAARIKAETGMITIGVGRINDPKQAEQIISTGKTDMVVVGRGQLADPFFCKKSQEGREDEIVRCVGCNQGCYDGFENVKIPHITCLRNPALGKENEYELKVTDNPKTVLIAGGGISGLESAITLKKRGHMPILCEATDKLGGQFWLAGRAPRKEEMSDAAVHMWEIAKKLNVDIRLNTTVTEKLILEVHPDTFINAIGSSPISLKVSGGNLKSVVNSHEVLAGNVDLKGSVIIIGGGLVGAETAEYLAERGCEVTILEMLPEVCADLGHTRKISVMENMHNLGIKAVTQVKVTEIKDGMVIGEKDGEKIEFPCNYAVSAIGTTPNAANNFERLCHENGIAYFKIGDASKSRRAIDATKEAAKVARSFDDPAVHEAAKKKKKKVFVTGASGGMGLETIKQLLNRSDRFEVRGLVRPSKANKDLMKEYISDPNFEVVWGDMKDYDTILRCVTGADYVLHIGAFVSPAADKYPEETMRVNIGSTRNIINAIKAQANKDEIKFAYVGTVAETGCRKDPIHWGRCGDPIKGSMFDYYAVSKIAAEREVFESGLKYWVSLRQTGILPSKEGAGDEPIIFHQSPNNVLEWVTAIESGVLMANICEEWIDESFWRNCYNIGGGKEWRFTAWEFANNSLKKLGLKYEDIFDPRQLATYNFHGQWYTDSDILNEYTHFRCITPEQYFAGVNEEMEALMANPMIASMMPNVEQIKAKNEMIGHKEMGFHWMFETNQENWIKAFFGSREKQALIKSFEEGYKLYRPSEEPTYLNHGYDETKALTELDINDMRGAAKFRGGECLSETMENGEIFRPLKWKCAFGHEFEATPNLVLRGGHWCPECERSKWNFAEMAKVNLFFAQVWTPIHGDEDEVVIKKEFNDLSV